MKENLSLHKLVIYASNELGILTRIFGVLFRRGYDFESLTICSDDNKNTTKLTFIINDTYDRILQIRRHLYKLVDIVSVEDWTYLKHIERELVLFTIKISEKNRLQILKLIKMFEGRIIELTNQQIIFETTGDELKFVLLKSLFNKYEYEIIEINKSGKVLVKENNYVPLLDENILLGENEKMKISFKKKKVSGLLTKNAKNIVPKLIKRRAPERSVFALEFSYFLRKELQIDRLKLLFEDVTTFIPMDDVTCVRNEDAIDEILEIFVPNKQEEIETKGIIRKRLRRIDYIKKRGYRLIP